METLPISDFVNLGGLGLFAVFIWKEVKAMMEQIRDVISQDAVTRAAQDSAMAERFGVTAAQVGELIQGNRMLTTMAERQVSIEAKVTDVLGHHQEMRHDIARIAIAAEKLVEWADSATGEIRAAQREDFR